MSAQGQSRLWKWRPFRGWRRWIVLLLLLGLIAGGGAVWWLTRPEHLKSLIVSAISRATGAQVSLGEARWGSSGLMYLRDLKITVPDTAAGEIFTADRVLVDVSWLSLLTGSVQADSLSIVGATGYLTEDRSTGRYLFESLLDKKRPRPSRLKQAPQVTISSGRIVFREIGEDGQLTELDELAVAGRLWTDDVTGGYQFRLQQTSGEGQRPTLRGWFNLDESSVSASLDGFRFEQPQRFFLRHELRDWWDRMQPQGAFSTLEVSYSVKDGWRARLVLQDASLNVPLGTYNPRMTQMSGRLRVVGHAVVLDGLEGVMGGLRYRVAGEVADVREKEAARFSLTAQTDWFNLQPRPRDLDQLPAVARKYYDRFQVVGEFRLQVACGRSQVGGPIDYQGRLNLRHVSGMYHKFPYPCHDVEGQLSFSRQAIVIDRLRGRGVGPMTFEILRGRITPPGDGAQVRVKLRCRNVPIDKALLAAMKDKHRAIVQTFFDQSNYQRLIDEQLIGSDWKLGGMVRDAMVDVDRPLGQVVRTQVTSIIDVAGLNVLYRQWPYPLTVQRGWLTLRPQSQRVNVLLSGGSGASGRVVGVLERDEQQRMTPKLHIAKARVPIDQLLIASLPRPQNQWLEDLHAGGVLVGDGQVKREADGQVNFVLDAALQDGYAAPYGGAFTLDDLAGQLAIKRHRLIVTALTGHHEGGEISIDGDADWAPQSTTSAASGGEGGGGNLSLDLNFKATDLRLGPHVLDLLPSQQPQRQSLAQLLDQSHMTGRLDAALHYHKGGDTGDEAYQLTLSPKQLNLTLANGPATFADMTGQLIAQPGRITLQQLGARFDGAAHLTVDGEIRTTGRRSYDLTISGDSLGVGSTLNALLPRPVRRSVDALKLDGTLVLDQARWAGNADQWNFDGKLSLIDADAQVGVPITHLDGKLRLIAAQTDAQQLPRVAMDLNARSLFAADRRIDRLNVGVRSGEDGRQLVIKEFLGSMYHGVLMGQGAVELGNENRYRFNLGLQDVELDPFLHPKAPNAHGGGALSASLTIEAAVGDPASRVGRGALEVRDARLYNQPIPLAALQALNLSLPVERSFDRASARYLVQGDTVLFDSLRFEAPGLVLSGAGSMDYPTQRLDLEMVLRNPTMPNFGAVSEVINIIKDEVLTIRLSGTLAQPQAKAVTFSGILRSWDQLFQAKAAGLLHRAIEPGKQGR